MVCNTAIELRYNIVIKAKIRHNHQPAVVLRSSIDADQDGATITEFLSFVTMKLRMKL